MKGNENGSTDINTRINQSSVRLLICTSGWVTTTAVVAFGPRLWWEFDPTMTLIAIVLNLITGAIMLVAQYRHLMSMDELQKQTHLEAMAISLGVTAIVTVTYGNMEPAGLLADTRPTNILVVTGVTYIVAVIVLWMRRTSE